MGELGDALALLHGAWGSFRTIRATACERVDAEGQRRAWEREAGADPDSGLAELLDSAEPVGHEHTTRFWLEKPARLRKESSGTWGTELVVRDGPRWLTVDADGLATTTGSLIFLGELEQLLDPSPLLEALRFQPLGPDMVAGRPAARLHAVPRERGPGGSVLDQLGSGADAYELAVDAERGILLRVAALVDGEPYSVIELSEVAFDEEFPAGTFAVDPPPRAPVHPEPPSQPPEPAAAPFTVLAPSAGAGWECAMQAHEDTPAGFAVQTECWRRDGVYGFELVQSAGEAEVWLAEVDWTAHKRHGVPLEAGVGADRRRLVRRRLDDSHLVVSSSTLHPDDLLELAATLAPLAD
jgi:hypothetical protein